MFSTIHLSIFLVPVLLVTGAVLPSNNTGSGKSLIDVSIMPSIGTGTGLPTILGNGTLDLNKEKVLETAKVDNITDIKIGKRKDTAQVSNDGKDLGTAIGGHSSGPDGKPRTSTPKSKLTPEKVPVLPDTTKELVQESSQDPGDIHKVMDHNEATNPVVKNKTVVPSSTASSVVDGSADVGPPSVNKLSVSVPPNTNTGENSPEQKSSTKKSGSKQTSTSSKKDKAPLNKNNEDTLDADQLPIPGDIESDYAVSPNLDGSEEIPYDGNNENNLKPNSDNVVKNTDLNEIKIKQQQDTPNRKETFKYGSKLEIETEDGGYFNYFIFITAILALLLFAFHNKRRLIAYIVEGRKPRGSRSRSRRRSSSSETSYRRLENNFE